MAGSCHARARSGLPLLHYLSQNEYWLVEAAAYGHCLLVVWVIHVEPILYPPSVGYNVRNGNGYLGKQTMGSFSRWETLPVRRNAGDKQQSPAAANPNNTFAVMC